MGFSLSGALQGGVTGFLVGGPVGALAGAGLGGLVGGQADDAREDAARDAARGEQLAIDESRRQFDLSRQDLLPFLERGNQAGEQAFTQLNDPNFRQNLQDQAGKQAGRFASAGGFLGGGKFAKDIVRGTAGVESNRINQLLALSGAGQNAGGSLANLGQNTASRVGGGLRNIGGIQAGSRIGKANSLDNLLNTATSLAPLLGGGLPRNRLIGAGGRLPGESFLNTPSF